MGEEDFAYLTETTAPEFVNAGGSLHIEMFYSSNGDKNWMVYGIWPNGSRIECIVPRTGKRKIYKTLDGLAAFHLRCHPDVQSLNIPLKTAKELATETAA